MFEGGARSAQRNGPLQLGQVPLGGLGDMNLVHRLGIPVQAGVCFGTTRASSRAISASKNAFSGAGRSSFRMVLTRAVTPHGPRNRHSSASRVGTGGKSRAQHSASARKNRRVRWSRNDEVSTSLCGSRCGDGPWSPPGRWRLSPRRHTRCNDRAERRISIRSSRGSRRNSSGGGSEAASRTFTGLQANLFEPLQLSRKAEGGRSAGQGCWTLRGPPSFRHPASA